MDQSRTINHPHPRQTLRPTKTANGDNCPKPRIDHRPVRPANDNIFIFPLPILHELSFFFFFLINYRSIYHETLRPNSVATKLTFFDCTTRRAPIASLCRLSALYVRRVDGKLYNFSIRVRPRSANIFLDLPFPGYGFPMNGA